jgi:hypothetical protein
MQTLSGFFSGLPIDYVDNLSQSTQILRETDFSLGTEYSFLQYMHLTLIVFDLISEIHDDLPYLGSTSFAGFSSSLCAVQLERSYLAKMLLIWISGPLAGLGTDL